MFKYFGYTKFGTESEHGFVGESSGIQFLGVAKSVEEGAVLVASYCHHSKIDKTAIKTVLTNVGTSGHFNFPTEEYIWNFLSDNGLIYILICRTNYPQRCAALCLDECKSTFESKYAPTQTISAKENSLSKGFKDQFRKLCVKYNNPADVDAIASAKRKVDSVKLVMQDNIELALRNCVKLETMEQATDDLVKKADIFKVQAQTVKSRMWWRNMKMWVIMIVFLLIILGAAGGVIYYKVQKHKAGNSTDNNHDENSP